MEFRVCPGFWADRVQALKVFIMQNPPPKKKLAALKGTL